MLTHDKLRLCECVVTQMVTQMVTQVRIRFCQDLRLHLVDLVSNKNLTLSNQDEII